MQLELHKMAFQSFLRNHVIERDFPSLKIHKFYLFWFYPLLSFFFLLDNQFVAVKKTTYKTILLYSITFCTRKVQVRIHIGNTYKNTETLHLIAIIFVGRHNNNRSPDANVRNFEPNCPAISVASLFPQIAGLSRI